MRITQLKNKVVSLLKDDDIEGALVELRQCPPKKLLKPLFSCLCSCDQVIKWHAISAMGQVVSDLADQDIESARIVMRRYMWMLNDESGGIGWGVPESIGEVCACHPRLAKEYTHILVSYMREDGFYLELEPLQRGLMWGIGRVAQISTDLLLKHKADYYIQPYLDSTDHIVKGLAALALGRIKPEAANHFTQKLQSDAFSLEVYHNRKLISCTVSELTSQKLL